MLSKKMGGGYTVEAPTSETEGSKKKKDRNWGVIIAVIAAVILVLLVIAAVLYARLFGNPRAKIDQAVKNTFESYAEGDNKLVSALNIKNILADKAYTVNVDGSTTVRMENGGADIAIDTDMIVNNDIMQMKGDVNAGTAPISFELQLDDTRLQAHLPLLDKYLFTYNYHTDNRSSNLDFLANQIFGLGIDTDIVNVVLSTVHDLVLSGSGSALVSEMKAAVTDELAEIPAKKASAERFTIDGAERRCNGYRMTLRHENIVAIADRMDNALAERYGDALELDVLGATVGDLVTQLRSFANQFNELTITFFVYKNELAAIRLDGGSANVTFLFKGGDYRAQNIGILYNGDEYCTVESSVSGNVESLLLVVVNGTYISYNYDTSDGQLTFNAESGTEHYEFSAKVVNSGNEFSASFGNTDVGDSYFAGTVTFSKNAETITMEERTEVDLSSQDVNDMAGFLVDMLSLLGVGQ